MPSGICSSPAGGALRGRAVSDFFRGLDVLRLSKPGIPDF